MPNSVTPKTDAGKRLYSSGDWPTLDDILAIEAEASAVPAPSAAHEWTDAPDDEEGWLCSVCGERWYPGDPTAHGLAESSDD